MYSSCWLHATLELSCKLLCLLVQVLVLDLIAHEEEEIERRQLKHPVFYGFFLNAVGFLMRPVGIIVQIRH
jgi:hypothetical protein